MLKEYDDGMVVNGYVIEVQEVFGSDIPEVEDKEQMYMCIDIMVESIEYIGKMANKLLHTNQ